MMKLVDVEVEAFGMLAEWLYTHVLERYAHPSGTNQEKRDHYVHLVNVWILARRFLKQSLQIMADDCIFEFLIRQSESENLRLYRLVFKENVKPLIKIAIWMFARQTIL